MNGFPISCPCLKEVKFKKELMVTCSNCFAFGHVYCYGYLSKADMQGGDVYCFLCSQMWAQNIELSTLSTLRFFLGHLNEKGRLHPSFYFDPNKVKLEDLLVNYFKIIQSTDADCLNINTENLKRVISQLFFPFDERVSFIMIHKCLSKFLE